MRCPGRALVQIRDVSGGVEGVEARRGEARRGEGGWYRAAELMILVLIVSNVEWLLMPRDPDGSAEGHATVLNHQPHHHLHMKRADIDAPEP